MRDPTILRSPSPRQPLTIPTSVAAALLLFTNIYAQEKKPDDSVAALPTAQLPSEPVVLSPFEVNTSRDTGFVANSSLAGGRLASDLRDTPVAYSVVTRDFMDALGITDLKGAADWSTSSMIVPDYGPNSFQPGNTLYTTRGTAPGRPQRNFFPQSNNPDAYNLERYDFGRGPNSILFGNGTLGGVSSSTTKRAQTNRAFQTIELSVGSWRNYRATLDFNKPLSDKVALRAVMLWGDSDGWRMKEFDRRKAAFLTSTFKPFRNTEVRLEGEYSTVSRQIAFTNLNDQFSGWDGKTTFATPAALATLPSNANALGVSRRPANYYVYDPFNGHNAIMNYQNDPITIGGGATPTTPFAGYTYGTNTSFNSSGGNILYDLNVPRNRFDSAISNSLFRVPSEGFTLSPDAPITVDHFRGIQLTVTHRMGNFYFELAGDSNRRLTDANGEQAFGSNATNIDINRSLPNGAPNPNFLQPYGDSQLLRTEMNSAYNNVRGAVAHVKESGWGTLIFNVIGGINLSESTADTRWLSLAQGDDHRQWGFLSTPSVQNVRVRRYWNQTSRPIPDLSLGPVKYIDPNTGVSKDIQPRWVIDSSRRDVNNVSESDFKYILGSLNAKFFQRRLIVLGAVRYDSYKFTTNQLIDKGDYPLDWDGTYGISRPSAPPDYATLTFVPKDASGRPIGPPQEAAIRPRNSSTGDRDRLYLNDRFKDDYNAPAVQGSQVTRSIGSVVHLKSWLSPSINYAETFNPPSSTVRIDGRQLEPTVASGVDFSLRMELLQSRLNLNFTYYENKEINSVIPGNGPVFFNTLYDANVVGDQSAGGRNIRGAGALPVQYRDMRTRFANGFEVEVVYNPTKALRLIANLGLPKVYESDLNPDVRAYIDNNGALFRQIAMDAGVLINPNNVATVDLSIPINQRSPDAQSAANAYNDISTFRANIIDRRRLNQDQPIGNIFADYTFQQGVLNRLRVGGGVKYRGKQVFGSRGADTIPDPANPTRAIDNPNVDAYTPAYTPDDYYIVTATLAYSWKVKDRREWRANLVVTNLFNDRGPIYSSTGANATVLRPLNNDYTSPARESVPRFFALKQPINFNLVLTLKF